VDRAVPGDPRGGPAVADERVLANRRVAVDALHRSVILSVATALVPRRLWASRPHSARTRDRHVRRNRIASTSREAGFSPTLEGGVWAGGLAVAEVVGG